MIWYLVGEFLHILAVAAWLGGSLILIAASHVARLTRADDLLAQVVHIQAFAVTRIFLPMAVLVTLSGLYMVSDRNLPLQAWLVWGLAGLVISGIIGAATMGPMYERAAELMDDASTRAEGARQALHLLRYATADMGVLISILFAMVLRPHWSDTAVLIGMALFILVASAWGLTREPLAGLD